MTKIEELIKYCDYVSEHGPDKIKSTFTDMSYYLSRYEEISKHLYFYLTDTEKEKADEFYKKYVKGRNFGAIGGGLTYTFTPTGLGDIKNVETVLINGDKISEDITDISCW